MPSPTLTRAVLQYPLAPFDPDTRDFIMRVERADGQALETSVRRALDAFVRGCKADGIWDAIKACCIMMGARTLAGALTPLKGAAPTNFNFVSGDYNRKTGLAGDGTTKYLDSNRNSNADPQNNYHLSVFASTANTTANRLYIGAGGSTGAAGATHFNLGASSAMGMRNRSSTFESVAGLGTSTGFLGVSRSSAASYSYRFGGSAGTQARTSSTPFNGNVQIFANEGASIAGGRLSFYSIGESLDLALLDARVTALRNAIATSIDGVTDPDARAYINAVEAADGQTLEVATAQAIGNFIVGCKADGVWEAIKACCIMMGARTLAGALTPLKGTAPTNFNFVSNDYDRKTGLLGNGSTKYLDSNRANNADPQNSQHLAVYSNVSAGTRWISGGTGASGGSRLSAAFVSSRTAASSTASPAASIPGFVGINRSSSANYVYRGSGANQTFTVASAAPTTGNLFVFANNTGSGVDGYSSTRLSCYSIGESLDLALLDARVTALSNAISIAF